MSRVVLVQQPDELRMAWSRAQVVRPGADAQAALEAVRDGIWVARSASALSGLSFPRRRFKSNRRLLVLDTLSRQRQAFLQAMFQRVLSRDDVRLLPEEVLAEVLESDERDDRFIGVMVDSEDQAVILYRGNLEQVVEPFSAFPVRSSYPEPDFTDVEVTDFGQTVRLGEYEASTSAILYEVDADYRKRYKANLVECDETFGGSLRRLRLQRGLKRGDFAPLDPKTIERIELNKSPKPHGKTLAIIAERLGVSPQEIETY